MRFGMGQIWRLFIFCGLSLGVHSRFVRERPTVDQAYFLRHDKESLRRIAKETREWRRPKVSQLKGGKCKICFAPVLPFHFSKTKIKMTGATTRDKGSSLSVKYTSGGVTVRQNTSISPRANCVLHPGSKASMIGIKDGNGLFWSISGINPKKSEGDWWNDLCVAARKAGLKFHHGGRMVTFDVKIEGRRSKKRTPPDQKESKVFSTAEEIENELLENKMLREELGEVREADADHPTDESVEYDDGGDDDEENHRVQQHPHSSDLQQPPAVQYDSYEGQQQQAPYDQYQAPYPGGQQNAYAHTAGYAPPANYGQAEYGGDGTGGYNTAGYNTAGYNTGGYYQGYGQGDYGQGTYLGGAYGGDQSEWNDDNVSPMMAGAQADAPEEPGGGVAPIPRGW